MSKGKSKGNRKNRPAGPRPAGAALARPARVIEADPADQSYSDQLIAETEQVLISRDHPAVLPYHQMNRRRRALVMAAMEALNPKAREFEQLEKSGKLAKLAKVKADDVSDEVFGVARQVAEFMSEVEGFCELVAFDQVGTAAWLGEPTTTDAQLLGMFSTFTRSFSLGEASSSSI